jgi:hypothetical protein
MDCDPSTFGNLAPVAFGNPTMAFMAHERLRDSDCRRTPASELQVPWKRLCSIGKGVAL